MVHRFPVTVHLLVLASCGLKLYFQIDGLRARSQEGGLEEYEEMSQRLAEISGGILPLVALLGNGSAMGKERAASALSRWSSMLPPARCSR